MRKVVSILFFFLFALVGGKMVDAHVVDLTNKAQAQANYEDYYPLIARYTGTSGVTFESYSIKWRTEQLKALEAELLKNKHGAELSLLDRVVIFPDYPAGENVLGQYFVQYQVGTKLSLLPNRYIHLYGGNDFTTPAAMATTLSHEYGHHFTYYYLLNKEQLRPTDWLRSQYASARELFRYPSVHADGSGAYEWYMPEILAEDYVQLFGSPNALKGHMQMNVELPTPFELPALQAYWGKRLGSEYAEKKPLSLLLTNYALNPLNASYYNLRFYFYSPQASAYLNAQDGAGRYASVYVDTFSIGLNEKWYDPSKLSSSVSWLFRKDFVESVLFRAVQPMSKGFNRGSTTLKIDYRNIAASVSTPPPLPDNTDEENNADEEGQRPLFPDITDAELQKAAQFLYERGIVAGYPDGTFRPNDKLLRRHAALMLIRELGLTLPNGYQMKATDVKPSDPWYKEMAIAEAHGLLAGYDGKLRPNEYITRAQMAAILTRAYANVYEQPTTNRSFVDVSPSFWAYGAINILAHNGITINDPFHPNDIVTRGQFALFLKRTVEKKQ
ncbi:S-layer homology domain-containing protein [Thermolongibacillus altinsuensis]|uniref:S-layer homology domain-containing protein n=1 Tax=Thermolongibacillus altinsuensis TaxID=575256 RepID=UPI00104E7BB3|nr:S-layer homology domain-containing protein [Thermolongibacillus altinsuensis]